MQGHPSEDGRFEQGRAAGFGRGGFPVREVSAAGSRAVKSGRRALGPCFAARDVSGAGGRAGQRRSWALAQLRKSGTRLEVVPFEFEQE